ncbi:cytochrome P450 [Laetiporus sulphureus 93-53]|uniref:Cytochrome P450 n=1 Tax=Laetiporus sulphureus 93-53 TaxID=1314785 RepID=A0A165CQD9_9APHY|nr:cytochrome P450 [Laetiporus sulphureus 93-53]KZT03231.1 cytochrome P450 [Laetiporus sulphureus 93-53]
MAVVDATILFLFLAIGIVVHALLKHKRLPLPPGPRGLPLLGNIYDVPTSKEWLAYEQWGRDQGSDVVYLNLCGNSVVIVNSIEAAYELFERRSSLYSDRPRMTMLNDLVGCDWHFVFMGYGDRWRERRRVFHQHFHLTAALQYRPRALKGARTLLRRLLENPDDFMIHLRHMAGALIVGVAYGLEVQPQNDPYVATAEKALHAMAMAGNAGSYLVDSVPFLKYIPEWFPGAKFKLKAKEWRKSTTAMVEVPFKAVKKAISDGIAAPSMILSLLSGLDDAEDNSDMESLYSGVAAAAYTGKFSHRSMTTTVSALGSFLLAMLLYPDVQRKAQQEIDRVTGGGRLPDFTDESSLPYVTAIMREVLRWRPVTPLAVPHRLTSEDEFRGYRLPAGSVVVGNSWAMLRDERIFPDPDIFRPERFLLADGRLNTEMKDAEAPAFGFGRRVCPGRHLAYASLWISIASILSTLDIYKLKDERGKYIEPSGEYTTGLVTYPLPFKCGFRPRSQEIEVMVRSTADDFE